MRFPDCFFYLISIKNSDSHENNEQKATTTVDIISHVDKPNFGENDFPSFDLGIDVTPKFIDVDVDDEFFSNEEVQRQLEKAFVTISESTDPDECNETGTIPAASVEITPTAPLKRISKPGRCLLSPYLPNDGSSPDSASKLSDDTIAFKEELAPPDDSDIFTFDDLFNKGYKPHNNDADNVIDPPFQFGTIPVCMKIWWHALMDTYSSLSDTHIDVCFYYIRQMAKYSTKVKIRATTTNCFFGIMITNAYRKFATDTIVLPKHSVLTSYVIGENLFLNTQWCDVGHVFFPILTPSRAHWILAQFDIKQRLLYVFNSSQRTVRDPSNRGGS
ncbi:uncharacterized protein Fot_09604 [Forsythia ovata]|uniref:Ubiquitin-like protease family profile domain-containing protein n=1 Tax=Forsythia ovata TaxID=205694 RepID=A0ABD1WEH3_9LAMI